MLHSVTNKNELAGGTGKHRPCKQIMETRKRSLPQYSINQSFPPTGCFEQQVKEQQKRNTCGQTNLNKKKHKKKWVHSHVLTSLEEKN